MSKKLHQGNRTIHNGYNDIVLKAGLADYSAVQGCMIIKPYGFCALEKCAIRFDKMFKDTGHVNAYFPLFIPKSFLAKKQRNVEGLLKNAQW